ncbi:MAG: hypothetical protein H0V25_06940, partial [Solirubrobacterales bacterium]|nr:hypothetical protein [Solirubrobacterales bacterium]
MRPPIFAIRSIFLALILVVALALWGAGSASAQQDQFTPLGPSQFIPGGTPPVNPNVTGQGAETSEASSSSDVPTGAGSHIESTGTSDSLGNVTSRALDNSIGEYWQKYPISRYGLDYHVTGVSTSPVPKFIGGDGIDFSGIPAMIASVVSKVIWWGCIFAAYGALALFEFAFNFDLLAGENSVLDPVSSAIEAFDKAIGNEFLAITITIFGLWAIWRALVQRRYGEVAGGFAASTVILIAAIAFTLHAQEVVGFASDTLDATTQKFLSIAGALAPEGTGPRGSDVEIDSGELTAIQNGNVDDGTLHATDALFKLLVYDNFVVLNYGGLEHCAKTGSKVEDDNPATSQAVSGCPDQDGSRASSSGGWNMISNAVYANRYLSYPQGDDRRCCGDKSEYRAISDGDSGKLPKGKDLKGASPPPPAYSPSDLGRADSPATDF